MGLQLLNFKVAGWFYSATWHPIRGGSIRLVGLSTASVWKRSRKGCGGLMLRGDGLLPCITQAGSKSVWLNDGSDGRAQNSADTLRLSADILKRQRVFMSWLCHLFSLEEFLEVDG